MESIKRFLTFNKEVGKHFLKKNSDDAFIEEEENRNIGEHEQTAQKEPKVTGMWELRKKSISQAVLIYETIQELQDRNLEDILFGPIKDEKSKKNI